MCGNSGMWQHGYGGWGWGDDEDYRRRIALLQEHR